jgi:hypothetical protein
MDAKKGRRERRTAGERSSRKPTSLRSVLVPLSVQKPDLCHPLRPLSSPKGICFCICSCHPPNNPLRPLSSPKGICFCICSCHPPNNPLRPLSSPKGICFCICSCHPPNNPLRPLSSPQTFVIPEGDLLLHLSLLSPRNIHPAPPPEESACPQRPHHADSLHLALGRKLA